MQDYFKYWGKAQSNNAEGHSYHLLAYHSLDVAATGWVLLDPQSSICQRVASQLQVSPVWLRQWFCFCLSLHDLGKFARAFQGIKTDLSDALVAADAAMPYGDVRHDSLGYVLWLQELQDEWRDHLEDNDIDDIVDDIDQWLEIVTGHHGTPPTANTRRLATYFKPKDIAAAKEFFRASTELLLVDVDWAPLANPDLQERLKAQSWQLAGLAVLADWLGSNASHFRYCSTAMPLADYWNSTALPAAARALKAAHLESLAIEPFTDIQQLFPFIEQPTPLQQHAMSVPIATEPQIFILEDVTGAGKTEAALILTHRLMSKGLAHGVYVALPTMATANGMYQRLADAYCKFYAPGQRPSLVLAHGARAYTKAFTESIESPPSFTESTLLSEAPQQDQQYGQGEASAGAFCSAWVADSRKKALLADVGVGTLDQALLGILPAKHQSLRMLGLAGKVMVVDEVHAYDSYMQALLESLLEAHARQGGSVLLLSATLPFAMRQGLMSAYARGRDGASSLQLTHATYPLASQWPAPQQVETAISTRKEVERYVGVERLANDEQVVELLLEATAQGRCVCWIRNSVNDARDAYVRLIADYGVEPSRISLFHSRFAMADRQRIENETLALFGKRSNAEQRRGRILIATQVVEQSLDLDFDLMVSDLAPVDLLIQRAGRLHRHVRDALGNRLTKSGSVDQRGEPILYLYAPDPGQKIEENWLRRQLPGTNAVYANTGRLWLTANLLCRRGGFAMPDDARQLVEGVYGEAAKQQIPDALIDASFLASGEDRLKASMADLNKLNMSAGYTFTSSRGNGGWDSEVQIPTRLTDNSVSVVLATVDGESLIPYAAAERHSWAMSTINLPEKDWHAVQALIDPHWQGVIEQLKREIPALRWLEVLPLTDEIASCYHPERGWSLQEHKH